ncbi:hypothetical protein BDQ17DRAFT_1330665 [Cyathus striatus]|nr:hypothetical protein BDQ17DRAFT_1330665 [Cyathus striatus]
MIVPIISFELEDNACVPHRCKHVVEKDINIPNTIPTSSPSSPLTPVPKDNNQLETEKSPGSIFPEHNDTSLSRNRQSQTPYRVIRPARSGTESNKCSSRKERKIRGIQESLVWFESTGNSRRFAVFRNHWRGLSPRVIPGLNILFQTATSRQYQSWMMTETQSWQVIRSGHPHPTLPDYCLSLVNRVPGWVTAKTIKTYKYRGQTPRRG